MHLSVLSRSAGHREALACQVLGSWPMLASLSGWRSEDHTASSCPGPSGLLPLTSKANVRSRASLRKSARTFALGPTSRWIGADSSEGRTTRASGVDRAVSPYDACVGRLV